MSKEKRYLFSLISFGGKTLLPSPMQFSCRKMRDEFARIAHAHFVFNNGERAMVRKTEVNI